jgi:hypothetical protein
MMFRRDGTTTSPPFFTTSMEMAGFLRAGRKLWFFCTLGLAPLAYAVLVVHAESKLGLLGFDFKGTIWQPGRDILAGNSPYPSPVVSEMRTGNPSVYPPLALVLTVPFALLPFQAAYAAWTILLVAGIVGTLWILDVRDWRCYTLALSSCPLAFGLALGNIVLLLLPLAALAWRYRNDARWSGLAVGLGIALKLVLWPLLVWFVATRRWRAAFVATGFAVLSTLVAWAPLGFDGFRDYPRLLSLNNDIYAAHSWSLLAGFVGLGLSSSVAGTLASLFGIALLLAAFRAGRQREGEWRAFCLAIVASIALVPIIWPASLALLIVPLALVSPRADRNWLVFMCLWIAALLPRAFAHVGPPRAGVPRLVWEMQHSAPPLAQIAAFVAFTTLLTVMTLRSGRRAQLRDA